MTNTHYPLHIKGARVKLKKTGKYATITQAPKGSSGLDCMVRIDGDRVNRYRNANDIEVIYSVEPDQPQPNPHQSVYGC